MKNFQTMRQELERDMKKIEKEIPIVKQNNFKLYDRKKGLTIPSVYLIGVIQYFHLQAKLSQLKHDEDFVRKEINKMTRKIKPYENKFIDAKELNKRLGLK